MALEYFEAEVEAVRAEAANVHDRLGRMLSEVDSDQTLSDEGKRIEREQIRNSIGTQLKTLRDKEMSLVHTKISDLERSIDGKVGNTSSDIIAFRDAQDRAERLETVEDARAVMERALRTSDQSLAYAVFRRALDVGWKSVTGQFTEANPGLANVAQELAYVSKVRDEGGFQRAMTYGLLRG